MMWRRVLEFLESANLRTIGILIGTVMGILFLFVGFWRSIVFVGFILAGYWVGRWLDNQEDWRDVINRLLPNKRD